MTRSPATLSLNGRSYKAPSRPTVVICADGCDPAYIARGLADGILPRIARLREEGFLGTAEAVMPSFTNPNNLSIVTGAPPSVHGISGNYHLDRASGAEVMMTDESFLRSETIPALFSQRGVKTAVVTAKDKLRRLLKKGLEGIAFSSECANSAEERLVGRERPGIYSADLSLFVLDAGIRLLEKGEAQLFYLSLSDYVEHAFPPGGGQADAFLSALDSRIGRFVELGAVVGLVADHGMNDKARADGSANVIFLEDALCRRFGAQSARVICPITDPFVRHHGALGSFVRVYVKDLSRSSAMMAASSALPGVAVVLEGSEAARRFELPPDREADFVVIGDRSTVLGSAASKHDLAGLAGARLRSHGGLGELSVPFLISRPLTASYRERAEKGGQTESQKDSQKQRLRNFDIFDFALNGIEG